MHFSQLSERDIGILEMLEKRQFATASVLFKNLREQLVPKGTLGDTILWCHLTKYGKIHYLENISSVYRRHSGGITGGNKVQWAKTMLVWNKALNNNHPEINELVFRKRNLENFKGAINYLIKNKEYKQALLTVDDLISLTDNSEYYKSELFSYIDELLLSNNKDTQLEQVNKQLHNIQHSLSFKIGRATTFPIRWIHDIPKKISLLQYKFELMLNKNKRELKDKGVIFINKRKIIKESKNLKKLPAVDNDKTPKLIVSLTSFPERITDIFFNLYSLLNQTKQPDMLILWLAEEEFPNKEKNLPKNLINLRKKGLTIKWCKDLKSYKKLIFALKEYPNDIIVTADDDIYYPENWLELLYKSYQKSPQYIHCHRAHQITFNRENKLKNYNEWPKSIKHSKPSFLNFCTTGGGVLYPPKSLYRDVSNEKLFMELCPTADDVWFWGMAVLKQTKIKVVENNISDFIHVNPELEFGLTNGITLYQTNVTQNSYQIERLINHFNEIKLILKK